MSIKRKILDRTGADYDDWNDWKWQFKHRVITLDHLAEYIALSENEAEQISTCLLRLRMAITPYYLSLINDEDPQDPIRRQSVPSCEELIQADKDHHDPLNEEADSPVPGCVHRYPDRVLVLLTDRCSTYCRHCTRRRFVGKGDRTIGTSRFENIVRYIRENRRIRDVLVSGGDPLSLDNDRLEWALSRFFDIPHVEIIRIGTRMPVVLPQRITGSLAAMLKKYHPLWINTHFNHPQEITAESKKACGMLADAGIQLGNQSVLLAGINDCPRVMKTLVRELVKIRVRPYYLYQCDMTTGLSHFRTPVQTGLSIMENLRGHISGLCIPTYVIDAPGGGGKIPVNPNYVLSYGSRETKMRNYKGLTASYPEPNSYKKSCGCPDCNPGRAALASSHAKTLAPYIL